jgi:DNA-binding NtrC family response regulator
VNVLLVCQQWSDDQTLAIELRRSGFRCDFASNLKDARRMLKSVRVDLVLCKAILTDGTGFGLAKTLEGHPVSAFIMLELDDGHLWMPAIDNGQDCIGRVALSPDKFIRLLEDFADPLRHFTSAEPPIRELQKSNVLHRSSPTEKHRKPRKSRSLVLA